MNEQVKLSAEALAQKIRWEGGLWSALEYGIHAADIEDPEIADLWARLEVRYLDLAPLLDETAVRLGVAA